MICERGRDSFILFSFVPCTQKTGWNHRICALNHFSNFSVLFIVPTRFLFLLHPRKPRDDNASQQWIKSSHPTCNENDNEFVDFFFISRVGDVSWTSGNSFRSSAIIQSRNGTRKSFLVAVDAMRDLNWRKILKEENKVFYHNRNYHNFVINIIPFKTQKHFTDF